jgi:hypothetical protein
MEGMIAMNLKDYGSKKKKRKAEYEKRKAQKDQEKLRIENYNRVMREGNIEQKATAMGLKLK